jgi:hypothetical protein
MVSPWSGKFDEFIAPDKGVFFLYVTPLWCKTFFENKKTLYS